MSGFDEKELVMKGGEPVLAGDVLWSGIRAFKSGRYDVAIPDLMLSAKNQSVDAARLLARIYYAGHGVPKNHELYMYWLARAAEFGDLASRAKLKRLIRNGVPASLQDDDYITRVFSR